MNPDIKPTQESPLWDFRTTTSSELDSEAFSPGRAIKRQAERGHFQPDLGVLRAKAVPSWKAGGWVGYYHPLC